MVTMPIPQDVNAPALNSTKNYHADPAVMTVSVALMLLASTACVKIALSGVPSSLIVSLKADRLCLRRLFPIPELCKVLGSELLILCA